MSCTGHSSSTTSTDRSVPRENALRLADRADLSAVVLDYRLGDADGSHVSVRLHQRGIPYVVYSVAGRVSGGSLSLGVNSGVICGTGLRGFSSRG
jgi:DNA-binding response OmpR family regulator